MATPDFEAWDLFVAVAEAGSFAGAAKARNLSVPTVSRAIARLEARLGASLFHRTSRRLSLSSLGAEALARAQELVQSAHQMETCLGEAASIPAGRIKMGAPLEFGLLHLASLLPSFLETYPQIQIDLDFNDAVVDIVASGHDLMLRIGQLADSSLIARRLCEVPLHLVASPSYLDRMGRPTQPEELAQHHCLIYSNNRPQDIWRLIGPQGQDVSIPITGPLRSNSGSSMAPALLAGLGIALVPDFLAYADLQQGRLEQVLPEWEVPKLGLYLVTPPNPLRPTRVQLLIDHLVKGLSTQPWRHPQAAGQTSL